MNIDKAIEILESGLVTQQEQEQLVTMLRNIQKNARRECCNYLIELHEKHKTQHNHFHVAAVNLWEIKKKHQLNEVWNKLDDNDFKYQQPNAIIAMKYAEAILKEKNGG